MSVTDIFSLRLSSTRLVTLSACETALAEKEPGVEISSLAEAFSIAGAPTVVASLWKVDDQATCELMIRFYQGLRQRTPAGRAIREAILG